MLQNIEFNTISREDHEMLVGEFSKQKIRGNKEL